MIAVGHIEHENLLVEKLIARWCYTIVALSRVCEVLCYMFEMCYQS